MDVTLLGTGNPLPDPARAGPSTLVRAGALNLLFDCGRGVVQRLAGAGLLPFQLSAVLLTHLHSDHITDLNDIVTTHWVMTFEPTALRVIGPGRTSEVMDGVRAMLGPDIEYRMAHHEDLHWPPEVTVIEVGEGDVLGEEGARVAAALTAHQPVHASLAYRVEHDGASVVIAGDTLPCDGLDRLCAGADAYVQTVLRDDLVRLVPRQRFQDTIDYHSTVAQAAQTAARTGVKTLVLTHFIPGTPSDQAGEWREMAAAHFDGEIVVGEDLLTISV